MIPVAFGAAYAALRRQLFGILSTALSMAVLIAAPANSIRAAEIKIVSADVFAGPSTRLQRNSPTCRDTRLVSSIQSGEFADVVILNRPQIDDLLQRKKVVAASIVNFARSGVGVAVRVGVPKPDISTVEALKRMMLAAKSISYPDPARGGLSGTRIIRVFERLGIVEEMKPKTTFP